MRCVLVLWALTGCDILFPGPIDTAPDAVPFMNPGFDAPRGTVCDPLGEACHSEPYPVNTVCHNGGGWCIDDVCRPMCSSATILCAGLVRRVAPAGAGYCEPR